ncbi:MAG TPA: cob(I)yrinic acid a,c-diamide adenosyltransferase [Longimicrobiales bacterium]|nr:cob(I)yrinic acid a,c-diamide adenosyltransferase [Longimicrobiales bacterium]
MVQRIYTKTGDAGETALFGGVRVRKSHPRVEAYGAVDELNAVLGWARLSLADEATARRLLDVQADLFALGAHLATEVPEGRTPPQLPPLPDTRIPDLEAWIDAAEDGLPELRSFILPGGSAGAAALHVARTVCRRAERRVTELAAHDDVAPSIVVYLNRLSDLLFVLARRENQVAGVNDVPWQPGRP